MKWNIPFNRVNWVTSSFLIGTALLSVTAVPYYIWRCGLDLFQCTLFFAYFVFTGLSITLGYHRLFSHISFEAKWPVKLFTLLFGAAAFQNSALDWSSDHRRHHKYVDHDEDPYDITKGFFYAHIGWLLFQLRPKPPMENVSDLYKDKLVMWQHNKYVWVALTTGFVVPTLLGWLYGGPKAALGAFLIGGVARTFFVHHMTFFINSACHTLGKRPYSSRCTARDSALMAVFTFGEGYHNFHHEFQHDYRNGVKPWQFDPTKWSIWSLSKLGLISKLRRVPEEKILLAELREAQKQIDTNMTTFCQKLSGSALESIQSYIDNLTKLSKQFTERTKELQDAISKKIELSENMIDQWRHDSRVAISELKSIQQKVSVLMASS